MGRTSHRPEIPEIQAIDNAFGEPPALVTAAGFVWSFVMAGILAAAVLVSTLETDQQQEREDRYECQMNAMTPAQFNRC